MAIDAGRQAMGKPYSVDLRERVVTAVFEGMSTGEAAKRFCVSKAAAGAWARLKRKTGSVAPARQGRPKGSVLDAHAGFILGVLDEEPGTTLAEMAERLRSECRIRVVTTAIWKFLDRRAMTHKKRPPMRLSSNAPM
jgi:transposase